MRLVVLLGIVVCFLYAVVCLVLVVFLEGYFLFIEEEIEVIDVNWFVDGEVGM